MLKYDDTEKCMCLVNTFQECKCFTDVYYSVSTFNHLNFNDLTLFSAGYLLISEMPSIQLCSQIRKVTTV